MNTAYIICGSPGAGKTFYAKKLAMKHGAMLLDIDTVAERLVQAGMSAAGFDLMTVTALFTNAIFANRFTRRSSLLPGKISLGPLWS